MSSKVDGAEELDGGFDLGENRWVGSETVAIIETHSIQIDQLLIKQLRTGTKEGIEDYFARC